MSGKPGWAPHAKTRRKIYATREVLDAAQAEGYRLTLRGVYYQLVARGIIPNSLPAYKSLSRALTKARWWGWIEPDALDDVSRPRAIRPAWDSPTDALDDVARVFRRDWWEDSDPAVEVWAEKAAVATVMEPVAYRYGVPFLACRGFLSLTAVVEAAARYRDRAVLLLYCGDHDPSGMAMDVDIERRMARCGADVRVERVALTREQVAAHNLPPNVTKKKDSRAKAYGDKRSWELDALPQRVLSGLVREAVERHLPPDLAERQQRDAEDRARLGELARTWGP